LRRGTVVRHASGEPSADEFTVPSSVLPPPLDANTNTKRLYLVRHGEVINPGGDRPVFYGALDVPLSSLGRQEARAAASYLANSANNTQLAAVYASPLQRAVYGAEVIAAAQQSPPPDGCRTAPIKVKILPGLKELDRGAWAGRTKDEIGPANLARFDACDESVTPPGGESYLALQSRVREALRQALASLAPGQAAAVVSHLQVTRCLLADALGVPAEEMSQLAVATASITCIDYNTSNTAEYDPTAPATVHFQSFKPDAGLEQAKDGAN
jgi:broad specificity phosphatase PhoE